MCLPLFGGAHGHHTGGSAPTTSPSHQSVQLVQAQLGYVLKTVCCRAVGAAEHEVAGLGMARSA
jgi:hypothetical protein